MAKIYPHEMIPIRDVSAYFKYDPVAHSMRFIGDSLEIRVSKRYEVYGLQEVTDSINTLGVMDVIIDNKFQFSLNILAQFTMIPTDMGEMVIDGVPYLVAYFKHGDVFMKSTFVVKNASVVYAIWVEYITRGKPLYTLKYNQISQVFDRVKQLTGSSIGVDRVVFELVVSHLARNPDNLFEQYRFTDMSKPAHLINLRSVAYAPTSTTARIIGSYFDDALTASMLNTSTQRQPFEDLLRGLPPKDQSGV